MLVMETFAKVPKEDKRRYLLLECYECMFDCVFVYFSQRMQN